MQQQLAAGHRHNQKVEGQCYYIHSASESVAIPKLSHADLPLSTEPQTWSTKGSYTFLAAREI